MNFEQSQKIEKTEMDIANELDCLSKLAKEGDWSGVKKQADAITNALRQGRIKPEEALRDKEDIIKDKDAIREVREVMLLLDIACDELEEGSKKFKIPLMGDEDVRDSLYELRDAIEYWLEKK